MNITALEREIRRVKEKLGDIDDRLQTLQHERSGIEHHLAGLETALKILGKPIISLKAQELRPDSEIARVRDILTSSPIPMHIDEILKILGNETKEKKVSLVGSINSYVKNNRIFIKVAPNTFTVLRKDENTELNETE